MKESRNSIGNHNHVHIIIEKCLHRPCPLWAGQMNDTIRKKRLRFINKFRACRPFFLVFLRPTKNRIVQSKLMWFKHTRQIVIPSHNTPSNRTSVAYVWELNETMQKNVQMTGIPEISNAHWMKSISSLKRTFPTPQLGTLFKLHHSPNPISRQQSWRCDAVHVYFWWLFPIHSNKFTSWLLVSLDSTQNATRMYLSTSVNIISFAGLLSERIIALRNGFGLPQEVSIAAMVTATTATATNRAPHESFFFLHLAASSLKFTLIILGGAL